MSTFRVFFVGWSTMKHDSVTRGTKPQPASSRAAWGLVDLFFMDHAKALLGTLITRGTQRFYIVACCWVGFLEGVVMKLYWTMNSLGAGRQSVSVVLAFH